MITTERGGLSLRYSRVNQAYFVMWGDHHVLRIFNSKIEGEEYIDALLDLKPRAAHLLKGGKDE